LRERRIAAETVKPIQQLDFDFSQPSAMLVQQLLRKVPRQEAGFANLGRNSPDDALKVDKLARTKAF
jgi:hypothetical protein